MTEITPRIVEFCRTITVDPLLGFSINKTFDGLPFIRGLGNVVVGI